ncbi:MAG TPA: sarcosine oxidase subunit gamma family protein [Usitatibacter sp.]|nr:sarcosine oxidase subunit gamma family protein [Usitatibacter sp.]
MPEHINLRGNPGDAAFASAARDVLGFDLPVAPNTAAQSGEHVACWLGPDEWLVATQGDGAALARRLREALGATFSSVTEVGGGNAVFVLAAANARELLAQECPLDLDPSVFGPGRCAQTRFAKAAVLLRPLDNGDIELTVRRSFADYLMHWIDTQPKEAR